jgi:hypothetical protein
MVCFCMHCILWRLSIVWRLSICVTDIFYGWYKFVLILVIYMKTLNDLYILSELNSTTFEYCITESLFVFCCCCCCCWREMNNRKGCYMYMNNFKNDMEVTSWSPIITEMPGLNGCNILITIITSCDNKMECFQ